MCVLHCKIHSTLCGTCWCIPNNVSTHLMVRIRNLGIRSLWTSQLEAYPSHLEAMLLVVVLSLWLPAQLAFPLVVSRPAFYWRRLSSPPPPPQSWCRFSPRFCSFCIDSNFVTLLYCYCQLLDFPFLSGIGLPKQNLLEFGEVRPNHQVGFVDVHRQPFQHSITNYVTTVP